MPETIYNSFLERVNKTDSCWLWTGAKTGAGYGALKVAGKMRGAHVVSFELHGGTVSPGLCVLHRCDVRACVRPEHLFLGSKGDNNRDRASKGRNGKSAHERPSGSRHPRAKLNEESVADIRSQYRDGGASQRELAVRFGTSQPNIGRILRGEAWRRAA